MNLRVSFGSLIRVCRPKSEGGLGIKRNEDVNKASITKLG